MQGLLVLQTVKDAIGGDTHNDLLDIDGFRILKLSEAFLTEGRDAILVAELVLVADQRLLVCVLECVVVVGEALNELVFLALLFIAAPASTPADKLVENDKYQEPERA